MEPRVLKGAPLEEFEKAVYGRKKEDRIAENDAAVRLLRECLVQLREGAGFEGRGRPNVADMTRFCSAMVALFLDPGITLTQDGFELVLSEKAVIETLFRASAYDGADFVFTLLGEMNDETAGKMLPFFATNSKLDLDLETVFKENPQSMIGLYVTLLGYGHVLTPQGHERREKLLGMAHIFKDVKLPGALWNSMCSAYMHCSYASGDNKHDCKRVFHQIIARDLKAALPERLPSLRRSDRPRLMVIFEWWHSKHAMFRSYAHSIRQLRERFHLIGCCAGRNTDQPARDIFDEWMELDGDNMNLAVVVQDVVAKKPDILYYPSIGMGIWVIAMASLRLAPIQVMSYGHPATSNSPEIDYGIIESDCLDRSCFSERMIGLPPNTVRPSPFEESIKARHVPKKKDRVEIAICAMQVKVTYPLIAALKEVQNRAKKPVDLRFYSAVHGIGLFSFAKDIAGQVENVLVQEQQQYPNYMESVAQADIVLFSFPFGGANTAYDCLTLGIPMVSLEGKQPHSKSDASIIRRAGLPEKLITSSVEEYIERIVELVNDDEQRIDIARKVAAVDLDGRFYRPDESGAFLKAFEQIYEENLTEEAKAA